MNDSALTIDQLDALSRAVPDDTERKDIRLYLQVPCSHFIQFIVEHCTSKDFQFDNKRYYRIISN